MNKTELREKQRVDIHAIVSSGCRLCDYWDTENYHCMLNVPIHSAYPCDITDKIVTLIEQMGKEENQAGYEAGIKIRNTQLNKAKKEERRNISEYFYGLCTHTTNPLQQRKLCKRCVSIAVDNLHDGQALSELVASK